MNFICYLKIKEKGVVYQRKKIKEIFKGLFYKRCINWNYIESGKFYLEISKFDYKFLMFYFF